MMDDAAPRRVELVCPAGTPASLRTAVDAGADTVYCGLQNATNARNFPGLNFSPDEFRKSVDYAQREGQQGAAGGQYVSARGPIPALEGRRRARRLSPPSTPSSSPTWA